MCLTEHCWAGGGGGECLEYVAEAAFEDAIPLMQNAYKLPVGKAIVRDALHAAVDQKAPR